MNKKTLMEIYNIIYEYAKQKQEHPEFIDLYKLYNIDPNKMASELKTDIRKVRRLIHIDQKRYIESSYYDFFDEIVQENSKLYDMEGNSRKKAEYDEKLKKNYEIYKTKPVWEPIFEPDASMISLIGDGAIKLNQAVPGYFNTDNLGIITGIQASNLPAPIAPVQSGSGDV